MGRDAQLAFAVTATKNYPRGEPKVKPGPCQPGQGALLRTPAAETDNAVDGDCASDELALELLTVRADQRAERFLGPGDEEHVVHLHRGKRVLAGAAKAFAGCFRNRNILTYVEHV